MLNVDRSQRCGLENSGKIDSAALRGLDDGFQFGRS